MTKNIANVIILGCGRSGTSIFGELFEHLPDYQYHSEPSYHAIKNFDFNIPMAIKVPKNHPNHPPTLGLSFPLEHLMEILPSPVKWYWQVRHPLDTICSLRFGIAKNWGHHPRPIDWQDWLNRPLLERCAHHWNYINTIGYEAVKQYVEIKHFEEMINDPLVFAENIAQEIGLDIDKNEVALQKWANRVQNTNNEQFVEAKTSKPYSTKDHKVRIGRWKENLTAEEVAQIVPIIKVTASKFGYRL